MVPCPPHVQWQSNACSFDLENGQIDVWRIGLDAGDSQVVAGRALLAADERERADRFRYARDRTRFVVGRANLRLILGRYLGQEPASLQFNYGPHGKPSLANLEFNLSHSENLALLAVTIDRPVGIDLEHLHPMADLEKLTARFFTPAEHQRIMQSADRTLAFFRTWTCKEAYLKATGEGLGKLKAAEFVVQPQQAAAFVNPVDWDVQELMPDLGFVGAIVAPGLDWRASFGSFS